VTGTAVRPGSLTKAFKGGPIGLYASPLTGDVTVDLAQDALDETDGLVLVLAVVTVPRHPESDQALVLTSSNKLGWVDAWDLGISLAGSVYSTR